MRNLSLAVLIMLTGACSTREAPMAPSSGIVSVSGLVLDFATSVGVSGATVAYGDVTAVSGPTGRYTLAVQVGPYQPLVNGVWMGESRVTGSTYRGDLFVLPGTCVSRYGTVADAQTLRPVVGATLKFNGPGIGDSAVTGPDGWYRLYLGCPANGLVGSNTTFLSVSHPKYVDPSRAVGRGVSGATRLDFALQPR